MTDDIRSVGELYKLYAETEATGLSVIGAGDYGIEAEWMDGQRFLICLGIGSAAQAQGLASFFTTALPTPKHPKALLEERSNQRRHGLFGEAYQDPLKSAKYDINPFKGYNVVAVVRQLVNPIELPDFR